MLLCPSISKRLRARASTLLGLLLVIASATAWIASYHVDTCWFWQASSDIDGVRYLGIYDGNLFFISETEPILQSPPMFPWWSPNFDKDRHELEMLHDFARMIGRDFGFRFGGLSGGSGIVKPSGPGSINLHYTSRRRGSPLTVAAVTMPLWLFVLLGTSTGTLPSILKWRNRLRRQSREDRGLCANCGYDLRASPDHCPECGEQKTGQ
jgi:hypothetical protein